MEGGDGGEGQGGLITDVKPVAAAVKADRRCHIDSVIIKVMKRLKKCSYGAMM